jgi:molybdate/tungstate transport system substrate-binding protein
MIRSTWVAGAVAGLGAGLAASRLRAQELVPLEVAYAGSMGSMMEGPIKAAAAQALGVDMHGRAQGSDALAQLIVGGSIAPDVFIPVTPGPMLTVLRAGKAQAATAVARTEMVIAYSPKSTFAPAFAESQKPDGAPWWQVLSQPGLRFGRTDPTTDPQGRNIIFTLQLAEAYYKQPGLALKILGSTLNPAQIFSEPTVEARLQSGEIDAASAYKIQPGPFDLPYVTLPRDINLGDAAKLDSYRATSLVLGAKTYQPQPLVYYATALAGAAQPAKAAAFVDWLAHAAQPIFQKYFYDAAGDVPALHA